MDKYLFYVLFVKWDHRFLLDSSVCSYFGLFCFVFRIRQNELNEVSISEFQISYTVTDEIKQVQL